MLVVPDLKWAEEFKAFYRDFAQNDADNSEWYKAGFDDFEQYVKTLNDQAKGLNLPEGYVPCNHYWYCNEEGRIVGCIRIRHHIDNPMLSYEGGHIGYDIAPSERRLGHGKRMLALALPEANRLGIEHALITADDDNLASRKIIETHGGRLDQIVEGRVFTGQIARYWVSTRKR